MVEARHRVHGLTRQLVGSARLAVADRERAEGAAVGRPAGADAARAGARDDTDARRRTGPQRCERVVDDQPAARHADRLQRRIEQLGVTGEVDAGEREAGRVQLPRLGARRLGRGHDRSDGRLDADLLPVARPGRADADHGPVGRADDGVGGGAAGVDAEHQLQAVLRADAYARSTIAERRQAGLGRSARRSAARMDRRVRCGAGSRPSARRTWAARSGRSRAAARPAPRCARSRRCRTARCRPRARRGAAPTSPTRPPSACRSTSRSARCRRRRPRSRRTRCRSTPAPAPPRDRRAGSARCRSRGCPCRSARRHPPAPGR